MAVNITIIGAGPGGYVAAVRAAQLGAEVTVIENDNVGGTCLNRGCIPSKVLITTADLYHKFQRAAEYGISLKGAIHPDMSRLMARKNKVVAAQVKGIHDLLKHHRVRYLQGRGTIKGPHLAVVKPQQGEEIEVPWDKLILAPGTRPLNIDAFPFDGDRILSSDHALNLKKVPQSILIVGGGVIGCEFAFVLASLGARVTVVEALSRLLPLPSVDQDCSKILQREMKKRKIKFMLNRTVDAVDRTDKFLRVTIGPSPFLDNPSAKEKKPVIAEVEKVLVCIGRTPNSDHMGLDSIGLKPDAGGWLDADERMATTADHVFAIGDVLGPSKVMLAHVASTEGLVAAENAMGADRLMDYEVVPGAIFTMPEVANVGLTESQARDRGINVRSESVLFRTLGKAQVIGEIAGQAKLVSDAGNGKILGVHIVGPHATDLIAQGAMAMRMGATVAEIASTIHAHPTLAEIMLEASLKSLGRALHG